MMLGVAVSTSWLPSTRSCGWGERKVCEKGVWRGQNIVSSCASGREVGRWGWGWKGHSQDKGWSTRCIDKVGMLRLVLSTAVCADMLLKRNAYVGKLGPCNNSGRLYPYIGQVAAISF
jgi:hypothetical protein